MVSSKWPRRWGVAALVSMLVLLSVLSSAGAGSDAGPGTFVVTGEPGADHEGSYEEYECGGPLQVAAAVTDVPGCGDFGGEHVMNGYVVIGFSIVDSGGLGGFVGALEANLTWSGGYVALTCVWQPGVFEGCSPTMSAWPGRGATFEFDCRSLPGSVGVWPATCHLGHD